MSQADSSLSFRQRPSYQGLLLGSICGLVGLLLVLANQKTQPLIEHHISQDILIMLNEVIVKGSYDNNPLAEQQVIADSRFFSAPVSIMLAKRGEQLTGVALLLTEPGWGGDIQFIMGINANGEVTGVRVISHQETPGLADKIDIEKDSWVQGFDGKSLTNPDSRGWAVKKDGGDFDQFTGATITPRSMVHGIHQGLLLFQDWQERYEREQLSHTKKLSHLSPSSKHIGSDHEAKP